MMSQSISRVLDPLAANESPSAIARLVLPAAGEGLVDAVDQDAPRVDGLEAGQDP